MIGHRHEPTRIRRVVVLIEEVDGTHHGYEVTDPTQADWEWTGRDQRGSTARIVVAGSFHRKRRDFVLDDERALPR